MKDKTKPHERSERYRYSDHGRDADTVREGLAIVEQPRSSTANAQIANRPSTPLTPADPLKPPLITAIEIENFKGIGAPVRIDLRPITLLFGRNSAGKSTIIQALCYAHEIFSNRNIDVHKTELGGEQIDLGGFRQFVHGHDAEREVQLRFELDLASWSLPDSLAEKMVSRYVQSSQADDFRNQIKDHVAAKLAGAAWVKIAVRAQRPNTAAIEYYEVGINAKRVGRIQKHSRIVIDWKHPVFSSLHGSYIEYDLDDSVKIPGLTSCLPNWHEPLPLPGYGEAWEGENKIAGHGIKDLPEFTALLSCVFVGVGAALRDELAQLRYLGPVRKLHPRTGNPQDPHRGGDWSDGSKAWELLTEQHRNTEPGTTDLLDDVNKWIDGRQRLNSGYRFRRRAIADLPADVRFIRKLQDYREVRTEFETHGCVDLDKWANRVAGELMSVIARLLYKHIDIARISLSSPPSASHLQEVAQLYYDELQKSESASEIEKGFINILKLVAHGDCRENLIAIIKQPDDRNDEQVMYFLKDANNEYRRLAALVTEIENQEFHNEDIAELARAWLSAPVRTDLQLVTSDSGLPVRTADIGVGISQILPVVVAALDADRPGITAIEQPELHVHPKMQVELGDLFGQGVDQGRIFLIESHSEHLILRLLRRIEETHSGDLPEGKPALKPDQVSVVFLGQQDGELRATRLRIDETGEFIDRWPQGFFDERAAELFY